MFTQSWSTGYDIITEVTKPKIDETVNINHLPAVQHMFMDGES